MSVTPFTSLADWHSRERRVLREIARLAGAYLYEPTDPAIQEALPKLREALTRHYELKRQALAQGYQS